MQTIGRIAILALILGHTCEVQAQDDPYRLPPNYIVDHYDIDLVIPTEALSGGSTNYTGYVEITFQVTVNTSEVKLHAASGYITLLTVQLDDTDALTNDSYSVNSTTNILTLNFPSELIVGESHVLKFDFEAYLITSSGNGLYRASYTDSDNEVQYLAATQFESTYARYAFPCFDEPGYKSTFSYVLTYPSEFLALTNTPEVNSTVDNSTGLTTTQFGTSPPMPVYLVAFTIAKYTCSEGYLEGSEEYIYRICSRPDKEYMRNYTMMLTPLVIDNFNSYTGINYTKSLSKLDQVAVSGKSGAMENWGLVLYRESGLLFDNTVNTNTNLQSILAVVSHELAHQWFGNLVTCKWWSETFLNEGFATLFEYYIADQTQPEFQMEKMLVTSRIHSIMVTDAGSNVPALRSNASTPSQISAKFNSYSYRKGAGVLRMAEHIIGRDVFKEGINKYLTDNQYQSVEPQDVWDALEAVSENEVSVLPTNTNLSDVMENWIEKAGFPVVNVTLNGSTIIMTQQRFLSSGTDTSGNTWYIPISYSTANLDNTNEVTTPRGWITPDEDFIIEEFTNSSAWIVVNNQEMGFYRVNYDTVLWNNLARALKADNFSGIHVLNRAQAVDDSDRLARAGYITIGQALTNTEFLVQEESYFVWYPAITFFSNLLNKTGSISPLGAALTQHFLELVETAAASVPLTTVNETAHIFTINQVLINNYACKYGSPTCVAGAKEVFSNYKSSYERPNVNLRSIVYCNAIRHSDNLASDWGFLYQQYQNDSVSEDSLLILSALGCTTNTTVLQEYLSKVLQNDSVITSSVYSSVFATVYSANELGVDYVLDFFIENYQAIIEKYNSSGLSNVQTIITSLGSVFTREDQIEKLENFVSNTEDLPTVIVTAATTAISTFRSNQELIETHRSSLYSYFGLSEETTTVVTSTTGQTSTTITTTSADSSDLTNTTTTTVETTTSGVSTLTTTGLIFIILSGFVCNI